MTLNIAVLASTKATDMQAIVDAIEKGLDARIVCVISNKAGSYALERAKKHGIESLFIDPKGKTREEYDAVVVSELEKRHADLVLLIGYMKIITPYFIGKFRNRIMNIHPSLLPAFRGGFDKELHQTVLDSGCKVSGCTLHFVTEDVDEGPIVLQKSVDIDENDTADSLKEKVQKAEQDVLVKAVKLFGEGKIRVEDNKVRLG